MLLLYEHIDTMQELTDEEFGCIVRALYRYELDGTEPAFSDRAMRMMWSSLKAFADTSYQNMQAKSKARSEAGKRGMAKRWGVTNDSKNNNAINAITNDSKNNISVSESVSVSNIPTTAIEHDLDADLAQIIQHYENVAGGFPRSALEKLQSWRELYNTEMILLAIDRAAEAGKRNWTYIDGTLRGWKRDGIKTSAEVAASDEQWQNRQQGRPGRTTRKPAESVDDQLTRVLANMDRKRGFEG